MSDINLLFGDSLEAMPLMQDNQFDYALVDPEYGIGENGSKSKSRGNNVLQKNGTRTYVSADKYTAEDWDNEPPSDEYFAQLMRVTNRQIIFGANYFKQIVGTPFKTPRRKDIAEWVKANPAGWVVWDKCNGDNDFNDFELIWCSWMPPTQIYRFMWNGMMQGKGMYQGWIQQGNKKLNQKRIHPTEKPRMLYRWLIREFGIDLQPCSVLDTGAGSFGIAIVCHEMGVPLTAYERIARYYISGTERFNAYRHTNQLALAL